MNRQTQTHSKFVLEIFLAFSRMHQKPSSYFDSLLAEFSEEQVDQIEIWKG